MEAQQREKQVLYLRHKIQRGFLSPINSPEPLKQEDISAMDQHFSQLESYGDLEPTIIDHTKVHKVLKRIAKLERFPEEYNFQNRAIALYNRYAIAIGRDRSELIGTPESTDDAKTQNTSGEEAQNKAAPSSKWAALSHSIVAEVQPEATKTKQDVASNEHLSKVENELRKLDIQ